MSYDIFSVSELAGKAGVVPSKQAVCEIKLMFSLSLFVSIFRRRGGEHRNGVSRRFRHDRRVFFCFINFIVRMRPT